MSVTLQVREEKQNPTVSENPNAVMLRLLLSLFHTQAVLVSSPFEFAILIY